MISPIGKFYIVGDDADAFMDLYCHESQHTNFGHLESTAAYSTLPVLVDADIKKEITDPNDVENLYDDKFVLKLVHVYQKVLRQLISDLPEDDLLCVVLQKDPYTLENNKTNKIYLKHGFHLHFPRLFLSRVVQEKELIPRVKLEWKKSVSQNEFNMNLEKVIDASYCKGTPWLLYRSRKADNMAPYLVSYVVDGEGIVDETWQSHLLYTHLEKCTGEKIELSWDNLDYYLPRIFSISPAGKNCYFYDIREDLPPIPTSIQNQIQRQVQHMSLVNNPRNEDESSMVDKLLDILSDERAVDRNEWMSVGWILHNIFRGTEEGLNKWVKFSQRSPENFSMDVCLYEWSQMKVRDMTIGSLKYIANHDNPNGYKDVMKEFINCHLEQAIKLKGGSHNDVAKALFEQYEGVYVCASIKERLFFRFNGHCWVKEDEGISLRSKISGEMVLSYEKMSQVYFDKFKNAEEEQQGLFKKKMNECYDMMGRLKSAPYKNNVMRECQEVFYNSKFLEKLDKNPFLFAFLNGVYDIENHCFREGVPKDMISICAPIPYRNDFTMDSPNVLRVLDFLEKIFPDRSVREYFLDIMCQIFIGGNKPKIFQVWTGEGDNGKSVMQSLFEKMLGSYSVKLPTSLIVGKRTQASSACPELVRAGNGVRMAVLQEPDQKDIINVGILKELSGNDTFYARGLYKEGTEITPMFKLILICNEPPKLPHNDKATWNRVRVIPFESIFSDNAPEDPDQQVLDKVFPKDPLFGEKVSSMAEAFAWYLLEHLKKHPTIRPEPEKVMLATQNYRRKNDVYRQFMEDYFVEDKNSYVSIKQAYSIFKEWFRDSMPNGVMPCMDDFREYMIKVIGEPTNSFWTGFKLCEKTAPEGFCEETEDDD
jgi:P4 family phage/plasmid primase-like protien